MFIDFAPGRLANLASSFTFDATILGVSKKFGSLKVMVSNPVSRYGNSLPLKLLEVVILSSPVKLVPLTVMLCTTGVTISKGMF